MAGSPCSEIGIMGARCEIEPAEVQDDATSDAAPRPRSARGCHSCLRYNPSPMSLGRTHKFLGAGRGIRTPDQRFTNSVRPVRAIPFAPLMFGFVGLFGSRARRSSRCVPPRHMLFGGKRGGNFGGIIGQPRVLASREADVSLTGSDFEPAAALMRLARGADLRPPNGASRGAEGELLTDRRPRQGVQSATPKTDPVRDCHPVMFRRVHLFRGRGDR